MNTETDLPLVTSTHPLKTIGLVGLVIACLVGSGSYFSSQRQEAEPTAERSSDLIEMVFGIR